MKDLVCKLAILFLVMIMLPTFILVISGKFGGENLNVHMITLYDTSTQKIIKISLEDYIVGVVSAEMPASFNDEALKAQAVASRSYALQKINSENQIHNGADLCTDFAHCQAYCDEVQLKRKWGSDYRKYYDKIKCAVYETKDEYLVYKGQIANTVYHSCSNGKTENAADVWGRHVEYLRCVDSEYDHMKSEYSESKTYSEKELKDLLAADSTIVYEVEIGEHKLTDGNNTDFIYLFGKKYTGLEIRKLLELKSTAFTVYKNNEEFVFEIYGNGHGVGMSQYGANGYAKNGWNYSEILMHYYPGTEFVHGIKLK